MNIGQLLADRAFRSPGATALLERRVSVLSWTFAEVEERATRLANWLSSFGVTRGTRVAVMLPNSAEHVEVLFGIARAGLVSVHVNTKLTRDEVKYILSDSGAEIFVVERQFVEAMPDLADDIPRSWVIVVDIDDRGESTYERGLADASPRTPVIDVSADKPFFVGHALSGLSERPGVGTLPFV